MEQQARRLLNLALRLGLVVGTLWLTARFLLPWAAPLLLSFAIAGAMEPLVRLLVRHRWRRGLAAGLISLTVLALLVWGLSALAAWGASAAGELAGRLPSLMAGLSESLDRLEERLLRLIAQAPEELSDTLRLALDAMGDWLYSLPAELGRWALDALRRLAQRSPDVLLFAVTAGIGSYFCSASWPRLLAFLAAQIPEDWKRRLNGLGADLKGSLGGWLRAQLILMGITFCELLAAFWLLGIESAPGMAALTAFVDALPLFGTGIILAPWALGCLLLGQSSRGLGLLIAWIAVSLVRNWIEAKLLGDQIGLHPLASLAAMYVGWQVWRGWGMLRFPVLLVTAQQLNDRGVVRLWRKV